MKKIFLYTIIISLITSFTACDDYLDVTPPSGFTEKYVFSSEQEIKSAVTGVYSRMLQKAAYDTNIPFGFNVNTDVEAGSVSTNVESLTGSDIACYQPKPTWTALNDTWNTMYSIINLNNAVLEGIENSDLYKLADKQKPSELLHMYGELKTLRAVLYLDMIRIWGDVLFRTKSSNVKEDMLIGVTDRNVILEYLIEDLKNVESTMLYAEDLDYGVERASREFCQGLIGLLAMNRAGWTLRPDTGNPFNIGYMEKGDNSAHYYDIAIEYLGKVISEDKHDLKVSFQQLWNDQCNWKTPNDDDILFAIPMLKNSSGQFAYQVGIPIDAGSHSYGSTRGRYGLNATYMFSFDKEDLRRDITCVPYKYDASLNQAINVGIMGLPVGKWSKLKMNSPLGSSSTDNTGINYVWMRFADVLLLYAEAVNENYGPRDDAKESMKRVRRRAFASSVWGDKVDTYVDRLGTKEDFFKAIMDERKWEFGGEGIRKYDLARWNKFSEVIYDHYHMLINWGKVATGSYVPGIDEVPANIYYKLVNDPNNAGRTILDIVGIDEYISSRPIGYTTQPLAVNWWALDNNLEIYAPVNDIRWSFRGFINYSNAASVSPKDPLRYLCPYPSKVITDHRGEIQNYYGFNKQSN